MAKKKKISQMEVMEQLQTLSTKELDHMQGAVNTLILGSSKISEGLDLPTIYQMIKSVRESKD